MKSDEIIRFHQISSDFIRFHFLIFFLMDEFLIFFGLTPNNPKVNHHKALSLISIYDFVLAPDPWF